MSNEDDDFFLSAADAFEAENNAQTAGSLPAPIVSNNEQQNDDDDAELAELELLVDEARQSMPIRRQPPESQERLDTDDEALRELLAETSDSPQAEIFPTKV